MLGALLIDKPAGPTSHDVVAVVRRVLKTPRVGHTGTLDPLATGLLVVLVGNATRLAQFLAADDKEYIADVRLGVSTPTYDAASLAEGVRSAMGHGGWPTREDVEAGLARFRGSFLQTPPQFSAKKVGGVAAYEKARKRQTVDLKPVPVTVTELELLGASPVAHRPSLIDDGGLLRVRVTASAGFYVRSLAHELGQVLGCGAYLEALRRTRVGRFRIEDAVTLDTLESASPIPPAVLLGEMPAATLTEEAATRAVHGNPVRDDSRMRCGLCRLLRPDGTLLAVADRRDDGLLHPVVVLG